MPQIPNKTWNFPPTRDQIQMAESDLEIKENIFEWVVERLFE